MKMKTIAFILLAVLLTLFTTPVYADGVPLPVPVPHAFYGTVEVNSDPAPVGTEVEARGEGVQTGVNGNPIVIIVDGKYGSLDDPFEPKLIVQGDIADGTTLTFYVSGVSTGQTAEWHSGKVTEVNLTVTIEGPPPGTTDISTTISSTGIFPEAVIAESSDGLCRLTIAKDTVGLTEGGEPLSEIKMTKMGAPPAPPAGARVIGQVYDFKPDGATFNPAATLKYTYDPTRIPEGVAENDLVLAWWDTGTGKWVELESTVNPEANTITAPVSHFTAFATLAYGPPEPTAEPTPEPTAEPTPEPTPEQVAEPAPPAPPAPPASPTAPAEPINWPVLWGVIGGAVVVGLVIFLLARRKAY